MEGDIKMLKEPEFYEYERPRWMRIDDRRPKKPEYKLPKKYRKGWK